jgi:predicted permease
VHWWVERTRKRPADRYKLLRRVAIALGDALRVRFQGGFGPDDDAANETDARASRSGPANDPWNGAPRGTVVRRHRASPLADLLQDARFALRGWRKHPVQTAAVLLTLALGIGANTAVFSVINAVLLNPLPYPAADRMFYVDRRLLDIGASTGVPYNELQELRARSRALERLEALDTRAGDLLQAGEPAEVRIGVATPELFDALELTPVRGRHFADADVRASAQPVVLIGERAWHARFAGRVDVVGTVVDLDGEQRVVVGIVDESIRHLREDVDFWIPLREAEPATEYNVLAWRSPAVTPDQALAETETIEFVDARLGRVGFRLAAPGENTGRDTRALLYAAFLAGSIVLLIASVNVAHLMLARTAARRGDLAVRKALGASRARLARSVVVESALLAAGGALLGGLLAAGGIEALKALQPATLRLDFGDARVDRAVLGYALLVLLLAMGITSLAPVFDSWRLKPHAALRESSAAVARGGGRLVRQGLLVAEVALSVTLLVGAGVLLHSLVRLHRVDPGYEPDGLMAIELELTEALPPADRAVAFAQVREMVGAFPGVEAATLAYPLPGSNLAFAGAIELESTGEVHDRIMATFTWAGPGYFDAFQIPLLEGRDFLDADATSPETPVIVSRSFANRLFPGRSDVGERFRRTVIEPGAEYVIVGVAGDARQTDPLTRSFDQQVYAPLVRARWAADSASRQALLDAELLLRAAPGFVPSPATLAERLRPLGVEVEAGAGFISIRDHLSWFLGRPRFNAILFGAFAAVALLMALVGLYGVVSHTVERRVREMAIRLAVGASASDVRRLVLLQGMMPVLAGILVGLVGASAAVRVITSLLYLIEPFDPPVFAAVPVLVLAIALAAVWVPARRATRVDPAAVIRMEA